MLSLRALVCLLWVASLFTAAASAETVCDHGDASAASHLEMTDMMDSASHGDAHSDPHLASMTDHADCTTDCCDGECACDALASASAALLPQDPAAVGHASAQDVSRTMQAARGVIGATEGPPPRTL